MFYIFLFVPKINTNVIYKSQCLDVYPFLTRPSDCDDTLVSCREHARGSFLKAEKTVRRDDLMLPHIITLLSYFKCRYGYSIDHGIVLNKPFQRIYNFQIILKNLYCLFLTRQIYFFIWFVVWEGLSIITVGVL